MNPSNRQMIVKPRLCRSELLFTWSILWVIVVGALGRDWKGKERRDQLELVRKEIFQAWNSIEQNSNQGEIAFARLFADDGKYCVSYPQHHCTKGPSNIAKMIASLKPSFAEHYGRPVSKLYADNSFLSFKSWPPSNLRIPISK